MCALEELRPQARSSAPRDAEPQTPDGELFRRIVEACPVAILVTDDQGRYIDANPMACRIFGYPREQIVGMRVEDFLDPARAFPLRHRWDDFRRHKGQSGEFPLVRPDGSQRVLRYQALADFAPDHPGLHVSFLEDVTEIRSMEQARQAAEARFGVLADGLPLIIWMGDAEGRSLYYNRHWYEYTGQQPPALTDVLELVHPEDAARLGPLLRDRRARGLEVDITYRLRGRDGAYRWHLSRSLPIRDGDGQVVCRVGAATDIEDQRRAIDDLQLERVLRERFVAALSHDLRSPLHAANMSAQVIFKRSDQPEVSRTQAARIIRSLGHADQLIQNLLDASRISAGEPMTILRGPCDLGRLLRDVVEDQATIFGDRFALEAPAALPAICDEGSIRRTLENLIGNAIKYGNPHTPVRIHLREQAGGVVLVVHNHGHPIPAEEQAKIFQPYHRALPQSRAGTLGWGLGLTLVRGVAEAHGGTVAVESSTDTGTTFTVTLGPASIRR